MREEVVGSTPSVRFDVADTGAGIKQQDQAKLFRAFEQLKKYGATKEGTGLGLYISQRLSTLLNGNITFVSEEGKGSTFTFTLPRERRDA